jgi:hypothetical protein
MLQLCGGVTRQSQFGCGRSRPVAIGSKEKNTLSKPAFREKLLVERMQLSLSVLLIGNPQQP